ncbi:LamG domain-containing protein [uncultured Nostoc sp.]|uniref:LamG domain-containing protein n=1 Tax=uncultured Nostoc sp. TaxID=340711 RepID=UPI0035CA4FEF
MQFIKQLGKQLGFVVLIGSTMFSASSAIAQRTPRMTTPILVNTDIIIDPDRLKDDFLGEKQLFLNEIGGTVSVLPPTGSVIVGNVQILFDPFNIYVGGYNNQSVGESKRKGYFGNFINGRQDVLGSFNEIEGKIELTFGLDPISVNPNSINPPALASNGTTCKNGNGCVRFHYGYTEDVITNVIPNGGTISPRFENSFIKVRDSTRTREGLYKFFMASPNLGGTLLSVGTINEYVVVYSEQIDPQQPDLVVANWTEFAVVPGAEQTLSFSNSDPNSDSVIISNTKVLRSATKIPLEKLNTADLPPTKEGFVPVPSANGSVAPGGTTPTVDVPITDITRVLNYIVSFNGTSDYFEIPDNENLNFGTGDLSISAWVKTTSSSGIEVILDKRVETTGPIQGYSLSNYNGSLLLQLADGVGNEFTNYITNISIADGNWHHVAVTVDRDQPDGGRWYIDGVEVVGERFNPTRRGSLSNSKPLVIGRRSDNPGWPGFFKGEIGSVLLVKRVLSSQEIQAIAANKP